MSGSPMGGEEGREARVFWGMDMGVDLGALLGGGLLESCAGGKWF